jgi:hypothetical protein
VPTVEGFNKFQIEKVAICIKWLRQTAHDQEVMSSNPGTVYWMDVRDNAIYYIKRKIENKGSQMGHTKKIFLKSY